MQVQEQMGRMMSMGGGANGSDVAMGEGGAGVFVDGMLTFRSDSPSGFVARTESPAPYGIDLPGQFGQQQPQGYGGGGASHAATMPVQYAQQQQFGDGFYPPHVQQTL